MTTYVQQKAVATRRRRAPAAKAARAELKAAIERMKQMPLPARPQA